MTDFSHIPERHREINARLEQWSRWVNPKRQIWMVHPMFRQYRAPRQYEYSVSEIPMPLNTLEAHETEKAVYFLPEKHRDAIRWFYVYKQNPAGMAKKLGVSTDGLLYLCDSGREMLKNRLQSRILCGNVPAIVSTSIERPRFAPGLVPTNETR